MNYNNSPYIDIPNELLDKFNLNGSIPVLSWFMDSRNELEQKNWDDTYLDKWINDYTIYNIRNNNHGWEPYPPAANWLLNAFEKYNIKNLNVAVVGSLHPWIESILLNLGNSVTTVEYNVPTIKTTKKIIGLSYWNFKKTNNMYDAIISYSSIEHSGLGRYGDPLDPLGDIDAMKDMYNNLKPNGFLFIGFPVGHDALVWNVHRIYGKIRLPLLFKNFKEIEWIGYEKDLLLNKPLDKNGEQPIIVLQK